MKAFDLAVIGSGAAGEKGAAQAAYFGKKVVVIERANVLGGARILSCALPSKALRETALSLASLEQRKIAQVGYSLESTSLEALMCEREPLVSNEIARVEGNLKRHGVRLLRGTACFEDAHTLRVVDHTGKARRIEAGVFLIATGSSPFHPEGIPFAHENVLDSDKILRLERLPKSLIVAGAGVIGCEYASMFAPLGVKVTLLEAGARLLPFVDAEVSELLLAGLRKLGVDVRLGVRAESVQPTTTGAKMVTSKGTLSAERVLFCAGRTGNTAELNLAAAGLSSDDRGRLVVNAHYQTAVPHIYASGDVIGFPALASTSMEQARVAMCHAFDLGYKNRVSGVLPSGIYTIPELSMAGESEESAKQKGIAFEVGRAFYRTSPRAQIAGDTTGLVKLVFAVKDKRLLGVHIVGERATELVHIGSLALQLGATIDAFIDSVYNYPTLSELYKYAAYDGLGRLAKLKREG